MILRTNPGTGEWVVTAAGEALLAVRDAARADERERLAAASPALHVERIVTPLLVAQGARDPRVPKAEVDRLVAALRGRGAAVEYLVEDDEGHGFRGEASRIAFEAATAAFLARALAP